MAILAGVYLYGFTTYSSSMVALENRLLRSPSYAVAFIFAGVVAVLALARARRMQAAPLIYEEQSDAQIQGLELN